MKHTWSAEKSSSKEPIIVNVQIINETNFIVLKSVNKDLLLTCFCAPICLTLLIPLSDKQFLRLLWCKRGVKGHKLPEFISLVIQNHSFKIGRQSISKVHSLTDFFNGIL